MDPLNPRRTRKSGPEAAIQERIVKRLKELDWYVMATHGNSYQSGFPDLYIAHKSYGSKWVEVKNALNYSFTAAQYETFPALHSKGVGIWILVDSTDAEISKLYQPANWHYYYLLKINGMRSSNG